MRPFSVTALNTSISSVSDKLDVRFNHVLTVDASYAFTAIPSAVAVTTGKIDQYTLNFADIGTSTDGDFIVLEDATGALWGAALDVDGSGVTLAGPVWTAIPAGKKVVVDVSALTNDEDIAAAVVAALNALVGFTAKITLVDNADGTVLVKTVTQYAGTATGTYSADESGAGSTTVSVASAGVAPTVHTGTEIIDAVGHGLVTGQVVKPTIDGGSLPSPLVSGTEYFVIKMTDNSFKLATTMALALLGTGINLTTEGTDNQVITFTPQANVGTVLVEYCSDLEPTLNSIWRTLDTINMASDTSPDITKTTYVSFHFVRATCTITKGSLSTPCKVIFHGK